MLGNLKKKLSNAIQEGIVISESLQHQYRQRTSTPTTPVIITPTSENGASSSSDCRNSRTNLTTGSTEWLPDVNMAAGCNLLAKYEDDWRDMQKTNETNAQVAEQIANQIDKISQRTLEERIVMADLISCLSALPQLVARVQSSAEVLQQVAELTAETEKQLERLQDLCEECELQEFMLLKHCELSQQKQKKLADLELYRQMVAATHEDKIKQHEARLRKIQRERQAVFDDAFRVDLEEYKQKGTISKIQKGPGSHELAKLEEVELEDNETKDALEEFLNG